ncbi:MAG: glycosyltransferase family 4 protein [Pirellulales bacterium]
MKIVYLAAGAGGMYCGACLHDNTLAAALMNAGHDTLLVPTYTPIRTDEADVSQSRVFFGGINVFLQQKSALFRHTPWLFDALLDSPALLRMVSKNSGSVDPTKLGDLTVSMLQGEHGRQKKELFKLIRWLKDEIKPDVVHVTNAILISLAGTIRRELGVPVVCGLAGEDVFLERLPEPWYTQSRDLLRQHARDATAFVSMNRYYADYMIDYMQLDPALVHVIPHGLNLTGHGTRRMGPQETVHLGYFARITPDKGLHHLVEAFRILCQDKSLPPLCLKAAGYLGSSDKPYLKELQRQLKKWGLADRFEYAGEPDRNEKIRFLQSLDVMSLPTVYHESKGLSVIEAWANAVPLVLPAHGTFPELVADTGGGAIF